jgi:hypothetical protein
MGFDVARKHLLVAEVVGDAGQVAGIADGGGGQCVAILPIAPGQFFRKVHGVAHRAAISARVDTPVTTKHLDQQSGPLLDLVQGVLVGEQRVEGASRLPQARVDVLVQVSLRKVRDRVSKLGPESTSRQSIPSGFHRTEGADSSS